VGGGEKKLSSQKSRILTERCPGVSWCRASAAIMKSSCGMGRQILLRIREWEESYSYGSTQDGRL